MPLPPLAPGMLPWYLRGWSLVLLPEEGDLEDLGDLVPEDLGDLGLLEDLGLLVDLAPPVALAVPESTASEMIAKVENFIVQSLFSVAFNS